MIPVVAIVGWSESGKTRVASALVEILAAQGYRVAAVKHAAHGHQIDRPGTDSARLFAAGAAKVVVSSPGQVTSFERREGDTSIEEIVLSLEPCFDLVIAEGFKESAVPKVLVLDGEHAPQVTNVIALITDGPKVEAVPCYSFGEVDRLAEQVKDEVMEGAGDGPSVFLVADGAPVSLAPFPANALAAVVRAFLGTLKGVPAEPRTVRLSLGRQRTPAERRGAAPKRSAASDSLVSLLERGR